MALIKRWFESETLEIAIWNIEESEAFLQTKTGVHSANKSPKKRLEHLTGRYLLQQMIPDMDLNLIKKTPEGKPYFEGDNTFFSLSHSYPYVACAVSTGISVGIDIQFKVDKIFRLQGKFLSEAEMALIEQHIDHITFTWCAKEAMFKKYGAGSVDFKLDMPIISFSQQEQNTYCDIDFQKYEAPYIQSIKGECLEDCCWAITL